MTRKTVLLVALTLFLSIPLVSCGKKYSAEPIEAWVIDAETKKPIEGVIVVANWELHRGTVAGRIPGGQLNVLETVTDKAGRFVFPGWGPKWAWRGYLDHEDPTLLFYKAGYKYRSLGNPLRSEVNRSAVRRSIWNGKKIELEKFKGSLEAYARHLSSMHTSVRSILAGGKCEWKKIPKLVIAIDKQEKIFRKNNIYSPLYSIEGLPSRGCGSPPEYFKGLIE